MGIYKINLRLFRKFDRKVGYGLRYIFSCGKLNNCMFQVIYCMYCMYF